MKAKLHRLGKTAELEAFVKKMKLDEPFDYTAPFIFIAKHNGELVFVNVFRLEEVNGKVIPRFIHILLDEPIRRSKWAIKLMRQAEDMLKLLGYTEAFSYILKDNKIMSTLAIKFGYIPDKEDTKARYYFKQLSKTKE
jgi:GNAT superfamily N-acetyltransferase